MTDATLVWDARAELGEGPIWDEREQFLHWVDVDGRTVHTYDPATGDRESVRRDAKISSLGLRERGGFVVAHDRSFALIEDGELRPLRPDVAPEGVRMNDGACDAAGRYFAGTVGPGTGVLYRLDPDGTVTEVAHGLRVSNGIDWSLDNTTMYYVDSEAHSLDAFDYDLPTGTPANRRVLARIDPAHGVPDGLTVDSEGTIWLAIWGGGEVRNYGPDGTLLQTLSLPVSQVTSCIFGGPELDTLYVTSARTGVEHEPLAGGLFGFRPGVRGRPAFRFGA